MSEPPDGAALRRQWDALCDETRAVVEAARQRARAAGDDGVGKYPDRQLAAISSN